jgi:hypothetical protein
MQYGFIYRGDDMAPAIRDGWTVWVGKKYEPMPGELIVLDEPTDKEENGGSHYTVFLVDQTDTHWIVSHADPDDQFEIAKSDWPTAKEVFVHASYRRRRDDANVTEKALVAAE